MTWTDERTAALRKMWRDGLTARQCADSLGGLTRNAILGKVYRMRLPLRNLMPQESRRSRLQRESVEPRTKRIDSRIAANAVRRMRPPVMEPTEPCDLRPDQSPYAVPFIERREGQCAWPLWIDATPVDQRMVCGAPQRVTGAGARCWCSRHCRIGYARPGT